MQTHTLSYKCLTGVQQHFATIHNHSLDSKVLPYVLRLTDLVMHDPEDANSTWEYGTYADKG